VILDLVANALGARLADQKQQHQTKTQTVLEEHSVLTHGHPISFMVPRNFSRKKSRQANIAD